MPTKAYYEGYNAHRYGGLCPYRRDTYSAAEWYAGYQAAHQGKTKKQGLRR